MVIGLLLTPILLTSLGSLQFGYWALLRAIMAYESVSDFGIESALVVFINKAESAEQKNRLITTGVLLNTATTVAVVVLLVVVKAPLIRSLFKVPQESLSMVSMAYDLTIATLTWNSVSRSLSAVLDSLQRVDVRFAVDTAGLCMSAALTWVLLRRGFGLAGAVGAVLLTGMFTVVAMAVCVRRVYRQFRFRWGLSRSVVTEILRFGLKAQGASLGLTLSDPLLKSLAALGLTAAEAGTIQVGSPVAAMPNSLAHSMIGNVFPAIAERHGQGDGRGTARMVSRYLLFVVAFVLPLSAFLGLEAPRLVQLWLHGPYPLIVVSVRLLVVAFGIRALSMVPWRVAWGLGRPEDSSVAMLLHLAALVGCAAALLLSHTFSYRSILLVYIVSQLASALYLYWCMKRSLLGVLSADNAWLLRAVMKVVLLVLVTVPVYHLLGTLPWVGGVFTLVLDAVVLSVCYLAIFCWAIPPAEKTLLAEQLRLHIGRRTSEA